MNNSHHIKIRNCLISTIIFGNVILAKANEKRISENSALNLQNTLQEVIALTLPKVVQVLTDVDFTSTAAEERENRDDPLSEYQHFFGSSKGPRIEGAASGFFIEPKGIVVTNAHAIEHASRYRVRLADGRELSATLIGQDRELDIAVLRILDDDIETLTWGDSSQVETGALVLAMGSPFGLANSVSFGIVSAVGRRLEGESKSIYIQTDAAINAGNSGGPLIDITGKVIGINTLIFSPIGISSGVGFAIPSALAREVVVRIISGVKIKEAWLGIIPENNKPSAAGVGIRYIFSRSPAKRAGLKIGDRILELNGEKIDSFAVLKAHIENQSPGTSISFLASGVAREIDIELASRPAIVDINNAELVRRRIDITAPLTDDQQIILRDALKGRYCPCPCGRSLANCFGCSEAKGEFTDSAWFVGLGKNTLETRTFLDPPVIARVWFDYRDTESKRLLQALERVEAKLGFLIRVRRRYYPADQNNMDGWKKTINAVEIARQHGHYDKAHRLLIMNKGGNWNEKIKEFPALLRIDEDDFWTGIEESRYEAQIQKDLTAGPSQFGITTSPTLLIGKIRIEEDFTEKKIFSAFQEELLNSGI